MAQHGSGIRTRGAIMVETVLVMIFLVFFLFLTAAMFQIWSNENFARNQAHRDTFYRASLFVDFNSVKIPDVVYQYLGKGAGYPDPVAADIPDLSPDPPDDFSGYEDFANSTNEGREVRDFNYSAAFGGYRGTMTVERRGFLIRPPWSWCFWPVIPTQIGSWTTVPIIGVNETQPIRDWFDDAYNYVIDDDQQDDIQPDTSPVN